MRRGWALLLMLAALSAVRAEPAALHCGVFQQCPYACVSVDPHRLHVDIATSGRAGNHWTGRYAALPSVRGRFVINGTFFSLRYHEPAGILVYDDGRDAWNPTFKRPYSIGGRDVEVAVATLRRPYLAVFENGGLQVANSGGAPAETVRRTLERNGRRLRCLIGGCGQLLRNGVAAIDLGNEGFDSRSGLRPASRVPRSALGVTADGHLLMVVAGLTAAGPSSGGESDGAAAGGLTIEALAELLRQLGARDAVFLDCGSSSALRADGTSFSQGRSLPTWLVAR